MDGENAIGIIGNQNNANTENGGKTSGAVATRKQATSNGNSNSSSVGGKTSGGNPEKEKANNATTGIPISNIPSVNIPIPPVATKKKKPADKDLDKTLESNMRILLGTGFGMVAKVTGQEIWAVSDEEAQSISTPLAKILQRLGINESMNKYADYIALTTALALVVVPRVLIQKEIINKAPGGGEVQINAGNAGKKNKAKKDNKPVDGNAISAVAPISGGIASVLDYGN